MKKNSIRRNNYKMHQCGIYKITNIITRDFYIGQTNKFNRRKSQHLYYFKNNKHCNYKLQNDYNLYGKDSFLFEMILFCEIEELDFYEQKLVHILIPYYNICIDIIYNMRGTKRSKEALEKMSNAWTPERRSKQAEWIKNYIQINGSVRKRKPKIIYYCEKCEVQLIKKSRVNLCPNCYKEKRNKSKRDWWKRNKNNDILPYSKYGG